MLAKQLGLKEDPNSSSGYEILNNNDVNFWILEFKSEKVYGPFDEDNFVKKRDELGISTSLKLRKIEDIK
ncbi:DUF3997 domain-containing protein [Alkalihalobacterium bogoriense]|uniref:DUF3997 domain-containing protein n=1 Tax=Alkalihalobacterium bogoriense TaxID=246272 RepID=UPI0035711880